MIAKNQVYKSKTKLLNNKTMKDERTYMQKARDYRNALICKEFTRLLRRNELCKPTAIMVYIAKKEKLSRTMIKKILTECKAYTEAKAKAKEANEGYRKSLTKKITA